MEPVRDVARVHVDCRLPPDGERTLRDDVLDGLTRPVKEIPPKHFYDARGSELFEQICELPEYYPTRTELALMREHLDRSGSHRGV
jgi:L-histidine N-alpha-methyltransferase